MASGQAAAKRSDPGKKIQKKSGKKRDRKGSTELCSTFSEAKPAGEYDSLRTDDAIALGPWEANCIMWAQSHVKIYIQPTPARLDNFFFI